MVFGYYRPMTFNDKILIHALPPALARALAEQWRDTGIDSTPDAASAYALIVTTAGGVETLPEKTRAAVPVLTLDTRKPQRIGMILRQARQMMSDPVLYLQDIALGDAVLNVQEKTITRAGHADIVLTDREAEILARLARARGRAVSRDDLLKNVWRYQTGIDTHTLETHVYRLRQKLAALPAGDSLLQTSADGGYRLSLPE